MTLGELIEYLSTVDPATVVPVGFGEPHSYRGSYFDLAFEPVPNTTVGDMLATAKAAVGQTYTGYKGGEYKMVEWTQVWISFYGEASEEGLGRVLLSYMIGKPEMPERWR